MTHESIILAALFCFGLLLMVAWWAYGPYWYRRDDGAAQAGPPPVDRRGCLTGVLVAALPGALMTAGLLYLLGLQLTVILLGGGMAWVLWQVDRAKTLRS